MALPAWKFCVATEDAIYGRHSAREAMLCRNQNFRPQLIRIPGQSPFRLEGFNFQASHRHLGQALKAFVPRAGRSTKGTVPELSSRKLLPVLFPRAIAFFLDCDEGGAVSLFL